MPTPLRELIDCLHGQSIQPTGEELADVLWLALRMGELEEAQTTRQTVAEAESSLETKEFAEQGAQSQPATAVSIAPRREEQSLPLYADSASGPAPEVEDKPVSGAQPFRTPAAPALPDSLAVSRALRPLMRKVPSRSRCILDEIATAEGFAERGLWLPVLKGYPERWLELALVVDASPSLRLWQPTLSELYRLLARHGAFHDLRLWRLGTDAQGLPVLSKGATDTPRRPQELLHPEGRRLVVLVSDCAAPAWYTGTYDRWLRLWGRHQPLALLHLLPPRFWSRGGLHRARPAQFRALAPGQPNPQLVPDVTNLPADPLLLPLFTLEPESVALWAQLLAGAGEVRSPGVILDKLDEVSVSLPPSSAQDLPAQQRLHNFRRSASPEAQTLTRYCAAVPLTLPVMQLLQAEMLPQSRQVHLAEIFFSGLLLRKNLQETEPERFVYDFRPEVRDLLLDTLRAPQILEIHQRLSEAVRRNLGRSADFLAFIPDLLKDGGMRLDARSLPFAEVGVTVLRRLGGYYVERAEQLAAEIRKLTGGVTAQHSAARAETIFDESKSTAKAGPAAPFSVFRDRLADGSEGPEMVWLPGGTFMMGDEKSGWSYEKPVHQVTLSPFSIGKYPVTFQEYDAFCEATGREKPDGRGWGRGTRPVINISWSDATGYCEWLSKQTGARYRLLTEAEWEYACRAGSSTRYCFGDDEQCLGDYAWYRENSRKTQPVGEKLPNAWQLYDMHGNVYEWVRDWYGGYSKESQSNPSGPETGSNRVIRGGCWGYNADDCRSACRNDAPPGNRRNSLGFRLARLGALPSYPFTLAAQQAAETPVQAESEVKQGQKLAPGGTRGYEPYQGFRDRLEDSTAAPEMVYLPAGKFRMGDSQGKGWERERPVHEVTLDAFAIGRYPVTVGEYLRFVEATRSRYPEWLEKGSQYHFEAGTDNYYRRVGMSLENLEHPIVGISWEDAAAYCEWLSEQTGEGYSLPSEAQWEYACRAGSEAAYCFGDDEGLLGEYAWYSKNAERRTHPVGQKRANGWGLYDMHGNVWEWVRDWFGDYSEKPQSNPSGPESGSIRVIRGGSWISDADYCRSAFRNHWLPGGRDRDLGFRLARRV